MSIDRRRATENEPDVPDVMMMVQFIYTLGFALAISWRLRRMRVRRDLGLVIFDARAILYIS